MAFCTFCMGICGCCGIGGCWASGGCCGNCGCIIGEFITGTGPPIAGNRIMLFTGGMGVATGETEGIGRCGIMNGCCP